MLAKTILTRGDEPEVEPVVTCTAARGCAFPSVREIAGIRYCWLHLEMRERPQLFATRDPDGNLYIPPNGQSSKFQVPSSKSSNPQPGTWNVELGTNPIGRPRKLPEPRCVDCGVELKGSGQHRCRNCWRLHTQKQARARARARPARLCPRCGGRMHHKSTGRVCRKCYVAENRASYRTAEQRAQAVAASWQALLKSV